MELNLKTLTGFLVDYFTAHKLISTVTVKNDLDFAAIPDVNYPIVNIEPVDSSLLDNQISQGFNITIADIMNTRIEGENNYRLIADMQEIASDAVLWLQEQNEFDASETVNYIQFEEDNSDRIAGVYFRINLIIYRETCVNENILDIKRDFYVDSVRNTVRFFTWLGHPYMSEYEITFDGGSSWQEMTKPIWDITSIPVESINQRLKIN